MEYLFISNENSALGETVFNSRLMLSLFLFRRSTLLFFLAGVTLGFSMAFLDLFGCTLPWFPLQFFGMLAFTLIHFLILLFFNGPTRWFKNPQKRCGSYWAILY
jgi:hypothetical protein